MIKTGELLYNLQQRISYISNALPMLAESVEECSNHEALDFFIKGHSESDWESIEFAQLQCDYDMVREHMDYLSVEIRELFKHCEKVDDLRNEIASRSKRLKELQTPSTGE